MVGMTSQNNIRVWVRVYCNIAHRGQTTTYGKRRTFIIFDCILQSRGFTNGRKILAWPNLTSSYSVGTWCAHTCLVCLLQYQELLLNNIHIASSISPPSLHCPQARTLRAIVRRSTSALRYELLTFPIKTKIIFLYMLKRCFVSLGYIPSSHLRKKGCLFVCQHVYIPINADTGSDSTF